MKKLNTMLMAAMISLPSLAYSAPKTHFSLKHQLFSETKDISAMTGARYELPYSYVSTNTIYKDGSYTILNNPINSGYFSVELKEPAADWSVSIDMHYAIDDAEPNERSLKLTAENGESVIVSIKHNSVTFNGQKVLSPGTFSRLTFAIKNSGDSVELTINGSPVGTAEYPDFNKLKFVEVQLLEEYMTTLSDGAGFNSGNYTDDLHDLIIGER